MEILNLGLQVAAGASGAVAVHSRRFRWLCFNGRKSLAVAFYVILIATLLGIQMRKPQLNLYDFFGVAPNTSKAEISVRYRRVQKALQTDSEMDQTSHEKLQFLKRAYEILTSDHRRNSYHRVGDVNNGEDESQSDSSIAAGAICLALAHGVLLCVVGYMVTISPRFVAARQIIVLYLIGSFCFELQARFVDDPVQSERGMFGNIPLFTALLPFEKVQLLRRLFPSVLSLAMAWSGFNFVDTEALQLYLLKNILRTNNIICMRLHDPAHVNRSMRAPVDESSSSAAPEGNEPDSKRRGDDEESQVRPLSGERSNWGLNRIVSLVFVGLWIISGSGLWSRISQWVTKLV